MRRTLIGKSGCSLSRLRTMASLSTVGELIDTHSPLRARGHSQIAVTMNIYGHVIPAMQQSAADEIDAALDDDEEPPDVGEAPG